MKIDKVLVSADDNPLYLDFWESCSRVWKEKMGLDPVLLYFGRENPTEKHGYAMALSVWRVSMRGYYSDDLTVSDIDISVLHALVDLCDLLLD